LPVEILPFLIKFCPNSINVFHSNPAATAWKSSSQLSLEAVSGYWLEFGTEQLGNACISFCSFDLLPVLAHFINAFDFHVPKYMRMTANQFCVMPWATSVRLNFDSAAI